MNSRTPRIGLLHELQHAKDANDGTFDYEKTKNGILNADVKAVNAENRIRKVLKEPKRIYYDKKRKIPEDLLE